ncbi:hypothetical protein [Maribacter sp.]|uniref:hypothetical protein n=1 Tax=Maribacter sp. TaxID=1897614 RepID=UPI0025C6FE77|nr:hypothetical protein [Maribacter sp.]
MKHIKIFVALIVTILLASCNANEKKEKTEKEIVHHVSSPAHAGSSLPALFTDNNKTLLSWVTQVDDSIAQLNYSYLVAGKWQEPKEIISGADWFVNWADFPLIAENNGNLLSHVLKKSSKEIFSYDIKLNVLPKGKTQWNTGLSLHTDGTKTEHGFVTTLPYKQNSFFITWLDGRNMVGSSSGHGHGAKGSMSIRAAEVSTDGTVSNNVLLDDRTCSCCQTTAAITDNGPVVLYRDRSNEEIRDISITRRVNGEWTKPKAIHDDGWKINGCPVNGPKISAIGNNLVVAWFTAVNNEPKVKLVFSSDGGENFDNPILISNLNTMGRVDVIMLDNENAIASWMETVDSEAQIKAMKINKSGQKSTPIVVSRLGNSRSTGFPQMGLVNDKVHFAWTDVTNEISTIKTAYVLLKVF